MRKWSLVSLVLVLSLVVLASGQALAGPAAQDTTLTGICLDG
jgi:hypothetical protein